MYLHVFKAYMHISISKHLNLFRSADCVVRHFFKLVQLLRCEVRGAKLEEAGALAKIPRQGFDAPLCTGKRRDKVLCRVLRA